MSFATNYEFPNVSNYDSDLREILKIVKELYNNYQAIFNEFQDIKEQFAEFKKVIDALPDTIKAEVERQLEPLWTELLAEIESRFEAMTARINALAELIDGFNALVAEARAEAKNYTDTEIAKLNSDVLRYRAEIYTAISQIQAEIDDLQWELPEVYDITKGVRNPLVAVLYNVYDAVRVHALTCGEYDALNLTAGEYDAKQIKAIDYDVTGVWELKGRCCEKVKNPYTGLVDSLQNVLDYMALNYIVPDNLTAGEYDALELTAQGYDDGELTAYQYDFLARQYLVA